MSGTWQAGGLCSCFDDCGVCCKTIWCPCVTYAEIKEALHGGEVPKQCCTPCCRYFCLCTFAPLFLCCITAPTRKDIRTKYDLKADCCGDCCTSFWCQPLALCQERRELKRRPLTPWPVVAPPEEQTYQPPTVIAPAAAAPPAPQAVPTV